MECSTSVLAVFDIENKNADGNDINYIFVK